MYKVQVTCIVFIKSPINADNVAPKIFVFLPPTPHGGNMPHIVIPSHNRVQAIQRFAQFSSALYTQSVTWNTKTRLPEPTPFKKLVPFHTMSVLLGAWTSFAFYTVTRWILFNKMDTSDISLTAGILLLLHLSLNTMSATMILTSIRKTEEICLLYVNSRLLSEKVGSENGKKFSLRPSLPRKVRKSFEFLPHFEKVEKVRKVDKFVSTQNFLIEDIFLILSKFIHT